jgi:hypothetical protein
MKPTKITVSHPLQLNATRLLAALLSCYLFTFSAAQNETTFTVTIRNIASANPLTVNGQPWIPALSPGVWVIHTTPAPLFSAGEIDYGQGLEAIARDGMAQGLADYLAANAPAGSSASGLFAVPSGSDKPGPALPGATFEFTFTAKPGDNLSFVTMFGDSNDLIFAPTEQGIPLFDEAGNPVSGDLNPYTLLWDDGTEVNEGPNSPNSATRSGPESGTAESKPVTQVNDGWIYPLAQDWLDITITPTQQASN